MKRIMAAMIAVLAIALMGSPAAAQQTTGNIQGRITDAQKAAVPGVTVTVEERGDRLHPVRSHRHGGGLPPGVAADRHLRAARRTVRVRAVRRQERRSERRPDHGREHRSQGRRRVRERQRHGGIADGRRPTTRRSAGRRHQADREPAAQRPAVRQPRGDDPGRRPRFPLRPDQEHAIRAADQRRQRPQRQLPDRRRRQQRRHRRRPARSSSRSRRSRSSTSSDAALQGGVRPQQRRRHERRHQERHQPGVGQLLRRCSATSR